MATLDWLNTSNTKPLPATNVSGDGITLPGGFSPRQAFNQVVDTINPFDGKNQDYNVFSEYSVRGGERSPANGAFVGEEVLGVNTTAPSQITPLPGLGGAGWTPTSTSNNISLNNTPQSAWTSQNQQLYDASMAEINAQRARAERQAATGIANVGDVYNQRLAGLNSGRQQATNDFNYGTTTNQQNYTTDSNRINSSVAQGLRGLLRQMGAMGAGGGSAYQFSAPEAAGEFAREQLSGAGVDYAGNARNLDRTYTMFNEQAEGQEKELGDWKTRQENQVRTQAEAQKESLLKTLRDMETTRAQAMGGNVQAALDPYTSQIRQAQSRIDELARFRPEFSGETPVYSAPELSRFKMADVPAAQVTPGNSRGGNRSYLNLLLGRDEELAR